VQLKACWIENWPGAISRIPVLLEKRIWISLSFCQNTLPVFWGVCFPYCPCKLFWKPKQEITWILLLETSFCCFPVVPGYLMHCIFVSVFFPIVQTCRNTRVELLKSTFLRLNLYSRSFKTVIYVMCALRKEMENKLFYTHPL